VTEPAVTLAQSPRVYAYLRTSTADQSTVAQRSAIAAYANSLGWVLPPERVFADEGVSGATSSRPALDHLRAEMEARRVDVVACTKLDRLGRSVRDVLTFYDQAGRLGVRVVCVEQGFDSGTAVGALTRNVLSAVAEFERELIRERTVSGMASIRDGLRPTRSGKPIGRPRHLTPELAEQIRQLRETPDERGKRRSWARIARITHHPASSLKKWFSVMRAADRSRGLEVIKGPRGFGDSGAVGSPAPSPQTDPFPPAPRGEEPG
jgi:putative DNA-invertase from lambdoid prophage Rac